MHDMAGMLWEGEAFALGCEFGDGGGQVRHVTHLLCSGTQLCHHHAWS